MQSNLQDVYLMKIDSYQDDAIYEALPKKLFSVIKPGNTVVLKPNWVLESHQYNDNEWEQVITHPAVITAVIRMVIKFLGNSGVIIIADGPELNANFNKILSYQPLDLWKKLADHHNITLQILDLREELYLQDKNVTIKKIKLPGDPKGKVLVNLMNENSEFFNHKKSKKGYFGGGSDIREVNEAHDGHKNLYSISRSIVSADVFINLPKLKTHKKGGITCSLKNLVGINTYRNFLPHNSIGTPSEGGDQFPDSQTKSRIESILMPFIHQYILKNPLIGKFFSPLMSLGKMVFGDNRKTIRGGSWHGNDTLWRMVLDINKVLFYANEDGSMKNDSTLSMKKYISIVDGIIGGEGNGPKAPDSIKAGYLIAGMNPVSVDVLCARIIGFNSKKIPMIENAFRIQRFPLVNFRYDDILIHHGDEVFTISNFPSDLEIPFKPHQGWIEHIEL